jgi:hypothetical protein
MVDSNLNSKKKIKKKKKKGKVNKTFEGEYLEEERKDDT